MHSYMSVEEEIVHRLNDFKGMTICVESAV